MTFVERVYPGLQWAEPFPGDRALEVKQDDNKLEISGLWPTYQTDASAFDFVRQYEDARKIVRIGEQRTGQKSPHIQFANADTDDKLISFVQRFGPVVADRVFIRPAGQLSARIPLVAVQDLQEFRNERSIYHAALSVIVELARPIAEYDFYAVQNHIKKIAGGVSDWPRQWQRELEQRKNELRAKSEPTWKLRPEAFERIEHLSSGGPDWILPPTINGTIVVCELLNVFRSMVFPNALEAHGSLRHGIRPLLYSILRREFLNPRDTQSCANTHCREFFEVERGGQRFCSEECSLTQRQREYWVRRGKQLREKRMKKRKKANRR